MKFCSHCVEFVSNGSGILFIAHHSNQCLVREQSVLSWLALPFLVLGLATTLIKGARQALDSVESDGKNLATGIFVRSVKKIEHFY